MSAISDRGGHSYDHPLDLRRREFRAWDAGRVFLEVVRRESFRAAGNALGLKHNTVRARIDELENELGCTLLIRDRKGVRLTSEGESVRAAITRMEREAFNVLRASSRNEVTVSGEVRITVTEGLGTFWLTPRLVEFQQANPRLIVVLDGLVHTAGIERLETDLAVHLRRPTAPELNVKKLGRLHLMPFVAPSYVRRYGRPKDLADLRNHRILLQRDDDRDIRATYDAIFPGVPQEGLVAFKTNLGSAYYWALAQGAGIGWLPTYAYAMGAPLIPLDELGVILPVDIWLWYHKELKRTARVSRTIDWVKRSFDAREFPWFRDEFIHPNKLEAAFHGEPMVKLFSGFLGR